MKETRIKALVVTMLLLCVALSMGCTDKPLDTPASVFAGVPTEEYTIEFKELNAIENRTWQEEQRWNELKFEMIYPSERIPNQDPTPKMEMKMNEMISIITLIVLILTFGSIYWYSYETRRIVQLNAKIYLIQHYQRTMCINLHKDNGDEMNMYVAGLPERITKLLKQIEKIE